MSDLCFTVPQMSFEEMQSLGSDYWKQKLYQYNLIVVYDIQLERKQFAKLSELFGEPWPTEVYKLNGESVDADGVVDWSDKTRLKKIPLPWHQDSPTIPEYRTPIRLLYSVKIPDSESGKIINIDTVRFIESLSSFRLEQLENIEVCFKHLSDETQLYWYPLISVNKVTGKRGLNLNAIDIDLDYEGLKKHSNYRPGNTHIIAAREVSTGKSVSMSFLADLIKECNEMPGNRFEHSWYEGQLMVVSNLDQLHYRTAINEDVEEERLIFRKTVFHDYQRKGK